MANRNFMENQGLLLYKRVVTLYPIVNVGAAGAVTLQKRVFSSTGAKLSARVAASAAPTTGTGYAKGDAAGLNSVTRTSAGAWTLTLSDPYVMLLQCSVVFANSGGVFTAPVMVVDSTGDVTTNTSAGQGGTIKVIFYNGSGVATDPGNPDQAQFVIVLLDSTEP